MFLYTYSCDCITVFIAEGKNGGFLKCGQIIHSPAEIRHSDLLCALDLFAFALCPSVERVMLK